VRNVPLPLLWTGPAIYHAASRASTENMAFLPEQGSLNLPRVGAVRDQVLPLIMVAMPLVWGSRGILSSCVTILNSTSSGLVEAGGEG
jgi:hypothetical protein